MELDDVSTKMALRCKRLKLEQTQDSSQKQQQHKSYHHQIPSHPSSSTNNNNPSNNSTSLSTTTTTRTKNNHTHNNRREALIHKWHLMQAMEVLQNAKVSKKQIPLPPPSSRSLHSHSQALVQDDEEDGELGDYRKKRSFYESDNHNDCDDWENFQ